MPPAKIHARHVAERFIAALHHKNAQQGDWRIVARPDPEQLAREGEALLVAAQELNQQADGWEGDLNHSLNDVQEDLRDQWQSKRKSPEIYDAQEVQAAHSAYMQSLDADQQSQFKKIGEARKQATSDHVKGTAFAEGVLTDDFALRVNYSGMSDHEANAMTALLNAALYPLTQTPTDMPAAISGGLFRLVEDDKAIGLKLYGKKGKNLPLENLSPAVEQVTQGLANGDNWQRVKTPRGVGYMIRQPYSDINAAYRVARAISKEPQYAADAQVIFYLNGAAVNETEFNITKKSDVHKEIALVLTGKAADDILKDQLGVDMHRVKEAGKREI